MKKNHLYLGLDGGGTYTKAAISDGHSILKEVTGGSINFNSIGFEQARSNLQKVISAFSDVCNNIGYRSVFIGNSALNAAAADDVTYKLINGIIRSEKAEMDSDLRAALCAVNTNGACAVVISGTGSVVAGRTSADSRVIHSGGWGYLLGDEGSAWSIASDALRAAVRGYERSAKKTELTAAFAAHFGLSDFESIIDVFYCPPMERSKIASLAPIVFECSDAGDEVAAEIIANNAAGLAKTAHPVIDSLPENAILRLYGGVFEHRKSYRELFCSFIGKNAEVLSVPPHIGALLEAFRLDGVSADADIITRT